MSERTLDDETRYRLMRLLEEDPSLSQRELARKMGVSLAKTNRCPNAIPGRTRRPAPADTAPTTGTSP